VIRIILLAVNPRASHFVGDLRHATDPALPLLLRDPPVAVLGEHVLFAIAAFPPVNPL
jgi:hypothetical protein